MSAGERDVGIKEKQGGVWKSGGSWKNEHRARGTGGPLSANSHFNDFSS